jgi:hypothetical protein
MSNFRIGIGAAIVTAGLLAGCDSATKEGPPAEARPTPPAPEDQKKLFEKPANKKASVPRPLGEPGAPPALVG